MIKLQIDSLFFSFIISLFIILFIILLKKDKDSLIDNSFWIIFIFTIIINNFIVTYEEEIIEIVAIDQKILSLKESTSGDLFFGIGHIGNTYRAYIENGKGKSGYSIPDNGKNTIIYEMENKIPKHIKKCKKFVYTMEIVFTNFQKEFEGRTISCYHEIIVPKGTIIEEFKL